MLEYNLFLFLVSVIGGCLPFTMRNIEEQKLDWLLAFSGSFLLSITLLHLLPETVENIGHTAGFFILIGFFIQLFIQRITHGVEHGHTHIHSEEKSTLDEHHHHHAHSIPVYSLVFGLSVHAFMEGIPLGFEYAHDATGKALYLAVAAHKLPESLLLTSLLLHLKGRRIAVLVLVIFSLVTPVAAVLAHFLGEQIEWVHALVLWVVPIVAGAFIQIATTIFFESGTRQHLLTWQKIFAIFLGVGLGLTTLLFE